MPIVFELRALPQISAPPPCLFEDVPVAVPYELRARTAPRKQASDEEYEPPAKPKAKRKKGQSLCRHGRKHYFCAPCGGPGICEHGRRRIVCKECGGSAICVHGKERSRCKRCGGNGICVHWRIRRVCKECGGDSISEPGRVRAQ